VETETSELAWIAGQIWIGWLDGPTKKAVEKVECWVDPTLTYDRHLH
jgi:hypothetical protein